eukprot:TRINITY_DN853_c0_g1_i1.p1 TRINITY_DN853_c0_g1~~TRINITY_DN853_c0_g1_i1.p1  ORF type:complete len:294 (-),score=75.42 TRINITY_DN853_c0_g1_i1:168-1049(-)
MSGTIDEVAYNERTRAMPRSLYDGPIIYSKNDKGETIEQRINPHWTAQLTMQRYRPKFVKKDNLSYEIDECGEPVPEPLLPDKYHPLCYCYRLLYDRKENKPRVYCVGIPLDDDIVIYSDVLPNKTWLELKEENKSVRNLNREFPMMQYELHKKEKESPLRVVQEYNEKKRKEEIEKELKMQNDEEEFTTDEDFLGVLPLSKEISLRSDRTAKHLNSLPIRNCKTLPRPPAHKLKNTPVVVNVKKKKKEKRAKQILTPEERIYFEIHGCTCEEYIERRQREVRKKLGVVDINV